MQTCDVVVVGAGLAGLTAARIVSEAGARVHVLEAGDRVGGRTLTQELAGDGIDLGGQWIGPTQERITNLLHELGLETFNQWSEGRKVMAFGDTLSSYSGAIPALPMLSLLDLQWAITRLERLSRRVPLDRPMDAPRAAEWDRITVEAWMRQHVRTREAHLALEGAFRAIFAAAPRDLSLLHVLFYVHSGGGLVRLVAIKGGAQQARIIGGAQQISVRLAERLQGRITLNSPVHAIAQDSDCVTVHSGTGKYQAQYVVVAIPPVLAGKIEWPSGLSIGRRVLHDYVPMGKVLKCVLAYQRPFWRDAGFSGEVVGNGDFVQVVFDDTPANHTYGALVGFALGDAAQRWSDRTRGERARAFRDELARFFGPQAQTPLAYVEKDWTVEPWSRGCYVGLMPPGLLTAHGNAVRAPIGRIHWAGTETALRWNGYMDGAVESGERAAEEILARSLTTQSADS